MAQSHLTDRISEEYPLAFLNIIGMTEWLRSLYVDPNERDTTRQEYRDLAILVRETFNHFYSKFLVLATMARIKLSESLSNLFYKLTLELHYLVLPYIVSRPSYT